MKKHHLVLGAGALLFWHVVVVLIVIWVVYRMAYVAAVHLGIVDPPEWW